VIAIDGPSGVGKSTLGKALARKLDYLYIDSGAFYRAVGLKALNAGVSLDDQDGLTQLAREAAIAIEGDPDTIRIFLDALDVSDAIRSPEASRAASVVATCHGVREAVVDKLRQLSLTRGVVMDGRDIGTRVFPDAPVKVFLDASAEVRTQRRWEEDRARGRSVSLEAVRNELAERDRRDRERDATPLVKAPDAVLIDSSTMNADQLLNRVLEIILARG
jgi:cytidylate kinase